MSGKVEEQIISIFNRDITQLLSINQISKILKKAYPHINSKVNQMISEQVLSKTNIGRSYFCSINLESSKSIALLSLAESEKKIEDGLKKELKNIKSEFLIYTVFMAKNRVYFVLDHLHDREAIKKKLKSLKKYELLFFSKDEFKNLVLSKPGILVETVVLYSPEKYYELLSEINKQLIGKVMF